MTDTAGSSLPLTGLQVESGQIEGIDEDGVITAPIIRVTLHVEDRRFVFSVPAELGHSLANSITQASTHSLAQYYTPREVEEKRRRARRDKRIAIAVVTFVLGVWMALAGLSESATFTHTGGVVEGVLGALTAGWEFVGMFVVFGALGRWLRRRRDAKRMKEFR